MEFLVRVAQEKYLKTSGSNVEALRKLIDVNIKPRVKPDILVQHDMEWQW